MSSHGPNSMLAAADAMRSLRCAAPPTYAHHPRAGGVRYSGDTTPCKVTPVILQGVVSPSGVTLHSAIARARPVLTPTRARAEGYEHARLTTCSSGVLITFSSRGASARGAPHPGGAPKSMRAAADAMRSLRCAAPGTYAFSQLYAWSVCVRERERERARERERVCVCERERERVCVCVCVCERERERQRERERERERE